MENMALAQKKGQKKHGPSQKKKEDRNKKIPKKKLQYENNGISTRKSTVLVGQMMRRLKKNSSLRMV